MRLFTALFALVFCFEAIGQLTDQFANRSTEPEKSKKMCESHFASPTQKSGQSACLNGTAFFQKEGREQATASCREKHNVSRRDDLACRIGIGLAEELSRASDLDKNKLAICQELYPIVTALDAYFQEACLAGAYATNSNEKANLDTCQNLSRDRSFVGPCAAGLSATLGFDNSKSSLAEHHKVCLQYFDKTQFHTGYRACLNSRAVLLLSGSSKTSVIKQCDLFSSNNKSETERAACIVGASISKSISEGKNLPTRFQTCGDGKVTYQDKNFLACLTAASLLEFMDKPKARKACKSVFDSRKSKSRGQCANFIEKL